MQKFLLDVAHADDRATRARVRAQPAEFAGIAAD
jgi:hypothetical protein